MTDPFANMKPTLRRKKKPVLKPQPPAIAPRTPEEYERWRQFMGTLCALADSESKKPDVGAFLTEYRKAVQG